MPARSLTTGTECFFDPSYRYGIYIDADHPVGSVTQYFHENPDIAFILYHEYECSQPLDTAYQNHSSEHNWREKVGARYLRPNATFIKIISKDLRYDLMEIGVGSPFDEQDDEMESPFVFVYQNRTQLRRLGEDGKGEVSILLSCNENIFKDEYQDADEKFGRCVVTLEYLTKLWLPEELVVTHLKGQDVAYVLDDRPTFHRPRLRRRRGFDSLVNKKQKTMVVYSWSWTYDGRCLSRERHDKNVTLTTHEGIAINQLPIYPLRFAPVEVEDTLKSRGNKVWGLRRQHLVAYSGRDFGDEKT